MCGRIFRLSLHETCDIVARSSYHGSYRSRCYKEADGG